MIDVRRHQIAAEQVVETLRTFLYGVSEDLAEAQKKQDQRSAGTTASTMDEFNRLATERQREGNAMLESRLVEVREEIVGIMESGAKAADAEITAKWRSSEAAMQRMVSASEARTEEKIARAVRSVLEQLPRKDEGGD